MLKFLKNVSFISLLYFGIEFELAVFFEVLFELDAFAPLADAVLVGFGWTAGEAAAVPPADWPVEAELLFCASPRLIGIFSLTRSRFLASSKEVT